MKTFLYALCISLLIHFIAFYEIKVDKTIPPQNTDKKTMPKGSQIKFVKLAPKQEVKKELETPKEFKKVQKPKPEPKIVKKEPKPIVKKPLTKQAVTPNYTQAPVPKPTVEPFNINDFLNAKEVKENKNKDDKELEDVDEITKSYIQLYGEEFNTFSDETKKYLKNSLKSIGQITQRYLEYPYLAAYGGQSGTNVIEFYLHPDGTISDAKIVSSSGYNILDWNTQDTIEKAYQDYPRPDETTKIIIYVHYRLY